MSQALRPKTSPGRRPVPRAWADVRPFEPTTLSGRAVTAWKRMNVKRNEVDLEPIAPIGLHECRHTFASLMIAAGVNAKSLSTYMGHSSITITLDRYGHLMPGNETEAAGLLDAYLGRGDVVRTSVASAGGIAMS